MNRQNLTDFKLPAIPEEILLNSFKSKKKMDKRKKNFTSNRIWSYSAWAAHMTRISSQQSQHILFVARSLPWHFLGRQWFVVECFHDFLRKSTTDDGDDLNFFASLLLTHTIPFHRVLHIEYLSIIVVVVVVVSIMASMFHLNATFQFHCDDQLV